MNKKHLFLLSTLIAVHSIFPAFNTLAITADEVDRNKTSWTIEELLAIKPEFDDYVNEQCGTDLYCVDDVRSESRSAGGLYGAIAAMEINKIAISEISPSLGKLKVYYMDEYFDYNTNLVTHDPITSFELYWIDANTMDPSYGYTGKGFYDYSYIIKRGEAEANGIHLIAYEHLPDEEEGWFTPYVYREYTFEPVDTFPHNSVYIYALTQNGKLQRAFDFSTCLPALTDVNNSCKSELTSAHYPKNIFTAGEFTEEELVAPKEPDTIENDYGADDLEDSNTDGTEGGMGGETGNTTDNANGETDYAGSDTASKTESVELIVTPNTTTQTGTIAKANVVSQEISDVEGTVSSKDYDNELESIETPRVNNAEDLMIGALGNQAFVGGQNDEEFPWWVLILLGASIGIVILGFATKRRK